MWDSCQKFAMHFLRFFAACFDKNCRGTPPEAGQTSKRELFAKIVNRWKPLTIFINLICLTGFLIHLWIIKTCVKQLFYEQQKEAATEEVL